jgi:hypothetical protein
MVTHVFRSVLIPLVAAGALAAPALAAPPVSSAPLPLEVGNQWVLRNPMTGSDRTIECDDESGTWRHLTGLFGADLWVYSPLLTGSSIYVWNDDDARAYPLFKLTARSAWVVDLSAARGDRLRMSVLPGTSDVKTPAGTFMRCREVVISTAPDSGPTAAANPDTASILFAPGVGPVKIVTPGGESFELATATVGRTVYPAAGGGTTGTTSPTGNGPATSTNHAPALTQAPEDMTGREGYRIQFVIRGTDADGDTLTYSMTGAPAGATIDRWNGLFDWTPAIGQAGTYAITFQVSDGRATDTATRRITVTGDPRYAWRAGLPLGPVDLQASVPVFVHQAYGSAPGGYETYFVHLTGDNSPGRTTPGTLTVSIGQIGPKPLPAATVESDGSFRIDTHYVDHPGLWSIQFEGRIEANRMVTITHVDIVHWPSDYGAQLSDPDRRTLNPYGSGSAQLH